MHQCGRTIFVGHHLEFISLEISLSHREDHMRFPEKDTLNRIKKESSPNLKPVSSIPFQGQFSGYRHQKVS